MATDDQNTDRKFVVKNGEAYQFRAIDFSKDGVKIELYDPREIGIAEENRLHAVILSPRNVRELLIWMRLNIL